LFFRDGVGLGYGCQVGIKVYIEMETPEVQAAVSDSVDGMPMEIVGGTGRIVPLS